MATKRGRPTKAAGEARERYMQVRLDDAEKAAFDAAARISGLPLSAWVRERLRAAARKELGDAGQNVPFLP